MVGMPRGKKSGKKDELIVRVEGCMAIKKSVDPKVDGGKWYDIKCSGSSQGNGEKFANENLVWNNFPTINIPAVFNEGHIYRYLIEGVDEVLLPGDGDVCVDNATSKSKRKGEMLFSSGFVKNVQDSEDMQHYYLRAHVHHSMKNELPLQSLVAISKPSGYVKHGSCTCVAQALQRCCHIAALLTFILDYVKANGYMVNEPSTSLPCTWKLGKKRKKNPMPLHKASYSGSKNDQSDSSRFYSWDPRPESDRKMDTERTNRFISTTMQLVSRDSEPSMWETLLKIEYDDFELDAIDEQILKTQVADICPISVFYK